MHGFRYFFWLKPKVISHIDLYSARLYYSLVRRTVMGRIDRSVNNLYAMPKGAFLRNRIYVYVNTNNKYVSPAEKKDKGSRGYTGHDSVCVGVLMDPAHPEVKKFYANARYLSMNRITELPDPPKYADSLTVGLNSWIAEVSDQIGLSADLVTAFGEEDGRMVLDLAAYMLSAESAVMQHFPAWARDHALFSEDIPDDTAIGQFLKRNLSVSKIKLFRETWALHNIGDGRIFLCYDSTNVNSQAEGVFIVQRGHAKDDPQLCQVNTDYVIRQSDGYPLTYLHSPGSVTDIAQASEMIRFISEMKKKSGKDVRLCLICDRGYISEANLRHMDEEGLDYILMLRTNFSMHDVLADRAVRSIRSYRYELNSTDDERYGMTLECELYKGGPTCCAQVIWSAERYSAQRGSIKQKIARQREELESFIGANEGKSFVMDELKWVPSYFWLKKEPGVPRKIEQRKRGRGHGTVTKEIPTVKITGYEDDEDAINREYLKAGIMIMVTSERMTAQETDDAYARRDCVEKTFQALKSHLGMDKIGVTTEEAMHGKGLVWFVASILHATLFSRTAQLRATDRKHYTVPAMIDQLEAIKADRNLSTSRRERRYKLTHRQLNILKTWNIDEKYIDERISALDE